MANKAKTELIGAKLTLALALMRENDPRRFAYLKRDVKRILVFGDSTCRGRWWQDFELCELTDNYVLDKETMPAQVASTLAHEAMHARLYRWGIGYEEERRVRVERICFKASAAFARRLPDRDAEIRASILRELEAQMQRDPSIWTYEGHMESTLGALREMGTPAWLVAVFRSYGMMRLRWHLRSQKRVK